MSKQDLRAMYVFINSLGAKGVPAPGYTPPGQVAKAPYIVFEPQQMELLAKLQKRP